MGGEESRIKELPSLQVQSLLALYWNMNYKDQKHFMDIHQYHEVDIPLPVW